MIICYFYQPYKGEKPKNFLIACCADSYDHLALNWATKKYVMINRQFVKGLWLWFVLWHESLHVLNPSEILDELYDKLSLVSLLFQKAMLKKYRCYHC